jgi:hypothetical protein
MTATLDELKRNYYGSQLGLTSDQVVDMSLSDLELQFFTNPPAGGGGGGGVASVTAADSTIVIGGTAGAPTVRVGSIDDSQINDFPIVSHGAVATIARPSTGYIVWWHGSVAPNNAIAGDLWVDTTNTLISRYNGSTWVLTSPGEIAYVENVTGVVTAAAGATGVNDAVDVPGVSISVPASARPIYLEYGGTFSQTVAGTGSMFMAIIETTGGGSTPVSQSYEAPMTNTTSANRKTRQGTLRLGTTVATRTFKMQLQKSVTGGTSPTVNLLNVGGLQSWLAAIAK